MSNIAPLFHMCVKEVGRFFASLPGNSRGGRKPFPGVESAQASPSVAEPESLLRRATGPARAGRFGVFFRAGSVYSMCKHVRVHGMTRSAPVLVALCLGATCVVSGQTGSQPPGSFVVPVYEKGSSRVIAVLHGRGRFDIATSRQVLNTVQVDYKDAIGQTNLVVLGTNCLYDFRSKTAVSSDLIRITTGDGRLRLEGMGFIWYQTNNNLVVSNDVHTIVQKGVARSFSNGKTDEQIEVHSDRFEFDYEGNFLSYSGHVRLTDPQFELLCERLTIRRSPTNTIEQVNATGSVVLSNRLEQTLLIAKNASYRVTDQEERIVLSGGATWTDGVRTGEADQFDIDRRHGVYVATGRARVTLPGRGRSGLAFLDLGGRPGTNKAALSSGSINVRAESLRLEPQTAQGAQYTVVAETNVVIRDELSDAVATADRAVFKENSGLELLGNVTWTSEGRALQAG
ncbi:MAG: hypothetical protein N3G20_03635, partial [Verrucomicrobiae bacterium]|nr:hypothetical protein [Verrucomicrobiae bacterium]